MKREGTIPATRIRGERKKTTTPCIRCGRDMLIHGGRSGLCRDCKESLSKEEWAIWSGRSTPKNS